MALLEDDERSEMPSLSWNSVVKRPAAARSARPAADAGPDGGDGADGVPMPAASYSTPPPPASTPLVAATHETATPTASAPSIVPPPTAPAPAPPTPAPAPPAPAPVPPPPAQQTPAPVAATQTPSVENAPATPTEAPSAAAASEPVAPEPVPQAAPVPTQPNPTISLPAVAATAPPAAARQNDAAAAAAAPRKPKKDRSGSLARLGVFFLVVGALVSAAVIFGRPYLFPEDWQEGALDVAKPIEDARGVEFTEPVLVTPQPSATHRQMVADQLLGDPASNLPVWRALGLAGSDSTDDATLQTLIAELSPVLYSTTDGQVYYDSGFTRSDRELLISQAMATAALDQEHGFSADAPGRTLDEAALIEAHVRQQAEMLAEDATNRPAAPTVDLAPLAFLPAVLDYRLTAPEVFADLLPPVNDIESNPLAAIASPGPGPLVVAPLSQLPSESVAAGDVAVGPAIVTDRSFWYLSFASHLDAATAYRMSNDLQGAGLQMVDGAPGRCAVATLATADAATNAALQADLSTWAAAASPALGAAVTELPDSSVQLRSCDPAGEFTSNIRFGVARELIAWRAVELAVTTNVTTQGGDAAEVDAATSNIASSPAALAAVQLPAGTAPADLADAARTAATDVIVAGSLPDASGEA